MQVLCDFCISFYSFSHKKNIMNDEKSDDDVDAKMYAAYSCVDCGQEIDSRKELEDHEPSIKISQEQVDND
jgi:hypothetical protein